MPSLQLAVERGCLTVRSRLLPRFFAFASAQTLTGTVKNGTTSKPAAGDDVVLIKPGPGHGRSRAHQDRRQGQFSFKLDGRRAASDSRDSQDVTYHHMAPPGTTSVEAEVYDVSKKVEGIERRRRHDALSGRQGQLQISRLFAVDNNSKPPRTQMNDQNLEFYCPRARRSTRRRPRPRAASR